MELTQIIIKRYRSIRDETIELGNLNVFIGGNAVGKSTILDVLQFLRGGVEARDFKAAVTGRGGIVHLGWKGEAASDIRLEAHIKDGETLFVWTVSLIREIYAFHVTEQVTQSQGNGPPGTLLDANRGAGWWWSGEEGGQVSLEIEPTGCALAAASADASFPARQVVEFVNHWGFFDPNPFLLRRDWAGLGSDSFDPYGRNLAETLYSLSNSSPEVLERIIQATRDIVGVPSSIETRESEGRFYFVQSEPNLDFPVHQLGASSGTLRMLALVTALIAEPSAKLIGIEEPENYVHPTALSGFVERLRDESSDVQFLVTTHSPLFLDYLDDPDAIRVVRRDENGGTSVAQRANLPDVRTALMESGFSLGQYHETRGFGVD